MKFYGTLVLASALTFIGCGGKSDSSAPASTESAAPAAAQTTGSATVSGSIKFTGAKPKLKKIVMNADAYCKTQHASVESDEVVVNPNGTLRYVYVAVKSGLGDKKFSPSSESVVLDQQGCMYSPHVVAVQTGQTLVIRNSDGVLHNVNARPKNNQGFNIGQPVKGMENKKTFTTAEVAIPVKCDVHPWMGGYIAVADHPFAAVSDESGAFTLKNLPAGTYEIEAWHEKYGTQTQSVTVGDNESKAITFTFKGA